MRLAGVIGGLALLVSSPQALSAPDPDERAQLPGVVASATREARRAAELPAAIERVDGDALREAAARVNVSEALGRVPGLAALNRGNYAQDLQVSVRGFGARSTFGVRGVRLFADGIPASTPDGQGQTASFDLDTAGRIEVLRGAFAALYGNSAGGVIQAFTRPAPAEGEAELALFTGPDVSRRAALRVARDWDGVGVHLGASHFETDGYRDHSAARRDGVNARLAGDAFGGRLVLVINALDQPLAQDPLGLTRAQFEANPRQADAAATLFDTRKRVRQAQAGVSQAWGDARSSWQARAYGGTRDVLQFLGLPGDSPLASGGVVDLGRHFGGAGVRHTRTWDEGPRSLSLTLAAERDLLAERRRGFVNAFGQVGALRRDESDRVAGDGLWALAEWVPRPEWLASAGVRYSRVKFSVADEYVTATNPDDSGDASYARTVPVAGLSWQAAPGLRLYASAGGGFETPTFSELAYRSDGQAGLNFSLRPATSRQAELGAKADRGGTRFAVTSFAIDTRDEIVVDTAVGGRTTFRNAPQTRRRGIEISGDGRIAGNWEGVIAFTWLDARFAGVGSAGTRLPGVASATAFAQLSWRDHGKRLRLGAEARASSRVFVNDANSDAASGFAAVSVFATHEISRGPWKLAPWLRVDNVLDRRYAGSVIVGEARGRFFEPSPGRAVSVGLSITDH